MSQDSTNTDSDEPPTVDRTVEIIDTGDSELFEIVFTDRPGYRQFAPVILDLKSTSTTRPELRVYSAPHPHHLEDRIIVPLDITPFESLQPEIEQFDDHEHIYKLLVPDANGKTVVAIFDLTNVVPYVAARSSEAEEHGARFRGYVVDAEHPVNRVNDLPY